MQSLRYLQGFALGDGWVHNRLDRFKLYVYDALFARKVRRMWRQVRSELGLFGSVWRSTDRWTGKPVWVFEVGGHLATAHLDLGLLKTSEGLYFLAGLWDADGNWSRPDESHPLGQARLFGGWHIVYTVKHSMKLLWGFSSGRMYVATPSGHTSAIGAHKIITRSTVYGTGILARSMETWVRIVGEKMFLKRRNV